LRSVSLTGISDTRRDYFAASLKPTITHVLSGIHSVPQAFEITSNKGEFKAINPAQVMMRA
jgi:hypothetical protein